MATETVTYIALASDSTDGMSQLLLMISLVASASLFIYAFKLGFQFWTYD